MKAPAFLEFVRTLPCAARALGRCRDAVQAHHAGARGLGQKSRDDEAIPLCDGHHDLWHDGPERPPCWATRGDRLDWNRAAIAATQAIYVARGGLLIPAEVF